MDSSASNSRKDIKCTTNFSKLSPKKYTQKKHKKKIIVLVNILVTHLFHNFSQVQIFKRKSDSKYADILKTFMGLVAVAVIQK